MPVFIIIIILGIIEGITEFLPVSSTGHLLIAQHWLPRQSDLFNVVIQGGAVLAVIPLFSERFKKIMNFARDAAARDYLLKLTLAFVITGFGGLALEKQGSPKIKPHSFKDAAGFIARLKQPAVTDKVSIYIAEHLSSETKQLLKDGGEWNANMKKNLSLDLNQLLASNTFYDSNRFAGIALSPETSRMAAENPDGEDLIIFNRQLLHEAYPDEIAKYKPFKLPEQLQPVAIALLVGGLLFLVVEFYLRGKTLGENVTWGIAIAVGFGQLVAILFPGASRSGTTILISLLMGLSRPAATEFSFLVSIPTMLAASGYKIFESFHHPIPGTPPENWSMVLLGTVVSAVISFIAVKWLLRYVQSHTFVAFGVYRIIAGVFILLLLMK